LPDGTWTYDASHYPEPMTPLSAGVWFWAMGLGIQAATAELRAPFGGFDTMVTEDGWAYERELEPAWEPDPAMLRAAALDVASRWASAYRPRCAEITGELRAMRPERLDPESAVECLSRLLSLVREQWRIHFLTVIPVHAAREVLHDAYVERLGKRDELEPYRLLEGLPNETLDADEALWGVSVLATERDVADVILELPGPVALERLRRLHHGREVLLALDEYLVRYGGRSRLHELSEPRQAERPELALESVRLFLAHPRELPAERAARRRERDELIESTLARLDSAADTDTFRALIDRVSAAVELEETHAYHIDYPGLAAAREALLGFGDRLVAEGRIDGREDVWYLRRDELADAVRASWGPGLQPRVAERRASRDAAGAPEPWLGEPPDPDAFIPPMVAKFYGVPGAASADGDVIAGTAASAGRTRGVARVVRGPQDFARVSAGEVLICTTTTPAWTPLFPSLAGLVTDTGGILCHAAVVAREYRLPAVVGAQVATQRVPDGALVELDGDTGELRILRT
jgi:rifampicin phosphotransferase